MNKDLIKKVDLLKFKTPNTWGENYSKVPNKSGIYFYTACNNGYLSFFCNDYEKIIYVGSSQNLFNRYRTHEVGRHLKKLCNVTFYFYETENFYEIEKYLIDYYKPICNYQHNKENKKRFYNLKKQDLIFYI